MISLANRFLCLPLSIFISHRLINSISCSIGKSAGLCSRYLFISYLYRPIISFKGFIVFSKRVYRVSQKGLSCFPKKYSLTTQRLADEKLIISLNVRLDNNNNITTHLNLSFLNFKLSVLIYLFAELLECRNV